MPPQPLRDNYWEDVEAQLKTIFYDLVFAPVMEILRKANPQTKDLAELMNAPGAPSSLLMAIRSGRVQYTQGVFSGDFSVAISKDLRNMGATFDHRAKIYRIDIERVPERVRIEAANYQMKAHLVHEEVKHKLDELQKNMDRLVEQKNVDASVVVRHLDKGFMKSAELLEVQPKLDKAHAEELAADYNKNLKLYINNFSKQSILTLREVVDKNAMEGYRFDNLTEMIRHRYGVTANKAKFLARQETGLFMAKFRKARLTQGGVRQYKWSTAHDERVRDSHKHLDGRVFSYDSPPITDRSTGAKNNPGEDFNCRCLDIPLLEKQPIYA